MNKIFEFPNPMVNPRYLLVFIIASFISCINDENRYNLKDLKYSRLIGKRSKKIKHIIFLNKEYVLLKEKLKEINM